MFPKIVIGNEWQCYPITVIDRVLFWIPTVLQAPSVSQGDHSDHLLTSQLTFWTLVSGCALLTAGPAPMNEIARDIHVIMIKNDGIDTSKNKTKVE